MVGRNVTLTQARLREMLDYDPATGIFVWKGVGRGIRTGKVAGSTDPNGYRYIRLDGEDHLAQRLAWFWVNNVWPSGGLRFQDRNQQNCAIDNLREGFYLDTKHDWRTKEGRAAYQFEYRSQRRNIARDRELKRSFGIDHAKFMEMSAEQNGVCAICSQPEKRKAKNGNIRHLAVDHDHETGAVRSLLCSDCNQMIGFSADNPELLEKGAEYIRQHKKLPWYAPTLTEIFPRPKPEEASAYGGH